MQLRVLLFDVAVEAASRCPRCKSEWADEQQLIDGYLYAVLKPWPLPQVESMQYDVFLSHSGADKPLVVELYLFLSALGLECFYDQVSIRDELFENIARGVAESRMMVAVLSRHYFDSGKSTWPQLEAITMCLNRDNGRALTLPVFVLPLSEVATSGALIGELTQRNGTVETAGPPDWWRQPWMRGNRRRITDARHDEAGCQCSV